MTRATSLAPLLERFFTQRLMQQRQASPHTISSYRDTFRQFLIFAQQRLARAPSRLTFEQIDAPLITAFLEELETQRGLSVRSRNLRLTAIHSFFRYAAFELPTHAAQIQRVLAIRANDSRASWSTFSAARRSMRCLRHRIEPHGQGGATTPSSSPRCKPGCGCRR